MSEVPTESGRAESSLHHHAISPVPTIKGIFKHLPIRKENIFKTFFPLNITKIS